MKIKLCFEGVKEVVHVTHDNVLQAVTLGAEISHRFSDLTVGPGPDIMTMVFEAPNTTITAELVRFMHTICVRKHFPATVVRETIYLPEVK